MTQLFGKIITKSNKKRYIKIKRNQLLILDALLNDGGFDKKYIDKKNMVRYSEHSGHLGFNSSTIDRIIVSALTNREDADDTDILLPHNLYDTYEYKYFFHTHPPTPYPGGRAKDGILYEFPSISDIFHFIDHYNSGNTIGSIVVTAEGYYIIYPKTFDIKKIKYDIELEDEIFEYLENEITNIQKKALNKYGSDFTIDHFYKNIAKDTNFLKMYNKMLSKYLGNQLKVILKTRQYDNLSKTWIIKQLYLPI